MTNQDLFLINFFQLFGIGVGATAILTLVTPVAANWSIWALIAVRVIEGFFEVILEVMLTDIEL